MKLEYIGDVNVRLDENDLNKILNGEQLSGKVFGVYSERFIGVNVFCSEEKFYSMGGVGEAFDRGAFQAWVLEEPREKIQLAFPWSKKEILRDYNTLDIKISRPALGELMKNQDILRENGGYFCGIARGIASGHIIDRLNLSFFLPQ